MDTRRAELIHFAQTAAGLDTSARIKLILLAAGIKPATFFALKITPNNIEEKRHLELHLHACKFGFLVGKPRAYEEIISINKNAVQWRIKGSWYGYDVFANKKSHELFTRYISLVKEQKHALADRTAGMLYQYPRCCIAQYVKEHNPEFLHKKYTNYSYYKHIHDLERAFPLLQHIPCTKHCAASKKMNARHAAALKKNAPRFWKQLTTPQKFTSTVVVDAESELSLDNISRPVFPVKDGHEYALITLQKLAEHYYVLAHLTKKYFARGTALPAKITLKYNYADVVLGKPGRIIKNLHHERHFVLP